MAKVIPLETLEERDQAASLAAGLEDATNYAPGWMVDESGVTKVIDRLDRAINAYDRKHEGDRT